MLMSKTFLTFDAKEPHKAQDLGESDKKHGWLYPEA